MSTTYQLTQLSTASVPFRLRLGSVAISNEQMYELCQLNRWARIERSSCGDLEFLPLASEENHWRTSKLYLNLAKWSMDERTGLVFDVGTAFVLPNGAMRSPDLAWVSKPRLQQRLLKKKLPKFLVLCPDFAIRLCNPQDDIEALKGNLRELIENGTRIAWLIDAENQQVHVFSHGEPEFCLDNPSSISAEPVLRGFSLHPDALWSPH